MASMQSEQGAAEQATSSEQAEPAAKQEGQPEPKELEAPLLGYVKGGTSTARSDEYYERSFREAEQRRDAEEVERRASQDAVTVNKEDGLGQCKLPGHEGGAVQYTSRFTAHPEIPAGYVLLRYLNRAGAPTGVECFSELLVGLDPAYPTELTLMMVCPRCQAGGRKHMQNNQMQIRQTNKWFELRAGMGPAFFRFEGQIYRSAGMITESELIHCHDCGWACRIVNNCVREE